MALLTLAGNNVIESAQQALARQRNAEDVRSLLLDKDHTNEIYGAATSVLGDSVGIMPTPDEVASKFSNGRGYRVYQDMQKNVLFYGALIHGRVDLLMSLKQNWLAGEKGHPDSEAAKEAMQSAFENVDDRLIAMKAVSGAIETGFAPAEMIYDVHARGKAKGLIAPVAVINRPVDWFRFDWLNRPYFRPQYYRPISSGPLSDYKVIFMRYGSLHTPYGRGEGQDCYPAVYAIHTVQKFGLNAFERFGYPIAVVIYPRDWKKEQIEEMQESIYRTYKNYLSFPGDVLAPDVKFPAQEKVSSGAFGEAHRAIIDQFQYWLSMRLWGSMLSIATQKGSFARDQVHDAIRLEKAACDASALESMVNRGWTRPVMLANFPQLEESLWPRFAIDAAPNSDLTALLAIATAADKLGFKVSRAWFSDTFTIPEAQTKADEMTAPQPAAQPFGGGAGNGPAPAFNPNAMTGAVRNMSESDAMICVCDPDGNVLRFSKNEQVLTENRGAVRAISLESGDTLVVTKRMLAA